MKNFVKFNQGNFVKIGKEKNIKVDTIDGTLFDWIRTFMISDRAMKKIIDNNLYIWVSYKAIREDNPLCNITSNDVVGRRLNKLVDLGLLNKFLSKEDGNKTFFCITKFAYTYLLEDMELPTQKSEPLPTQKSDNSKLEDSKLIVDSKIDKKDKLFLSYKNENSNASETELKIVEDFISYRKSIKDNLNTTLPIKSYLKALMELHKLGYKIQDCILKMKENEWKTIRVEYIHKEDKNKNQLNTDSAYGGWSC